MTFNFVIIFIYWINTRQFVIATYYFASILVKLKVDLSEYSKNLFL